MKTWGNEEARDFGLGVRLEELVPAPVGGLMSNSAPTAVEGVNLSDLVVAPDQPRVWEVETEDRLFFKQMHMARAGTFIPQHSHDVYHSSLLAVGALRLWKDGVLTGDHEAPKILPIEPRVKHLFQSLVDNTVVYCAFNLLLLPKGTYEFLEEHNLRP